MANITIPIASALVGLLVGAGAMYVRDRAKVKTAVNKFAVERILLKCLVGACKEILSEAFQKKVERKYIELANAEIAKMK